MIPTGLGPRAEAIYDRLLLPMSPGDFLTHAEWRKLGTRSDLDSARRRLLREQGRALEVDRGVGYRLVRAAEHERIARKHGDKARRQIRRGRKTLTVVLEKRLEELTTDDQTKIRSLEEKMRQHDSVLKALNSKAERHEKALQSLQTGKVDRAELERVRKEMLDKIESLGLKSEAAD